MGPRRFCIVLDNPSAVYFPGQVVTGKVDFWIEESTKLRGIDLTAKGESRVHWTEQRTKTTGTRSNRRTETETIHYTSQEQYFHQKMMLLHQGGDTFELAPGNYQHPFSFQLPLCLPSSFEGHYGHIRYTIKASAQRPWKFNFEAKVAITVNTIVDLNTIPLANEAAQGTDSKTLCCWCCASGPISARVSIDKMGCVPGQGIAFSAEVDNKSGRTMRGTKVQLIQYTTFLANGAKKMTERVISEQLRGSFQELETWIRVPVLVPPVVPSNLPFCNNIRVDYRLQFSVDPGSLSINLRIPLNVIIGNVPLRCDFSMFHTPSAPVYLSTDVPAEAFGNAAQYADLPPPSYEEVAMKSNIREEGDCEHVNHGGTLEYAPRYLTYQTKG